MPYFSMTNRKILIEIELLMVLRMRLHKRSCLAQTEGSEQTEMKALQNTLGLNSALGFSSLCVRCQGLHRTCFHTPFGISERWALE